MTGVNLPHLQQLETLMLANPSTSPGSINTAITLDPSLTGLSGPVLGVVTSHAVVEGSSFVPPMAGWNVREVVYSRSETIDNNTYHIGILMSGPYKVSLQLVNHSVLSVEQMISGMTRYLYRFVAIPVDTFYQPGQVTQVDHANKTMSVVTRGGDVDKTVVTHVSEAIVIPFQQFVVNALAHIPVENNYAFLEPGGRWSKYLSERIGKASSIENIIPRGLPVVAESLVTTGTVKILDSFGESDVVSVEEIIQKQILVQPKATGIINLAPPSVRFAQPNSPL
jgi:hypothetical protein